MKTFLYASVAAALLGSCTAPSPQNQYQLKGAVQGVDGQEIYLAYMVNDSTVVTDTARIAAGAFEFSGKLERPYRQATLYMGDGNDYMNRQRCGVYLEPAEMTILLDTGNFAQPIVTGSFTQAQGDSLAASIASIRSEAASIYQAIETEKDPEKNNALREQLEPYIERMKKVQKAFVRTHPDSFISPIYLRSLMSTLSFAELKEMYAGLSDRVKQYGDVEEVESELEALGRTQPGMPAPDFATMDVHGDSIRFSEAVKGKYVLLDFWASWCVPCRKSFPHVKALYDKYHSKGFEVFCVADNDSSPDKWREAIEKDGVEKFFHVLRGLRVIDENMFRLDRTNDISDKYAIHFLPTKYLIDKDFKIVGKFNDEELDAKLKEIFGE